MGFDVCVSVFLALSSSSVKSMRLIIFSAASGASCALFAAVFADGVELNCRGAIGGKLDDIGGEWRGLPALPCDLDNGDCAACTVFCCVGLLEATDWT